MMRVKAPCKCIYVAEKCDAAATSGREFGDFAVLHIQAETLKAAGRFVELDVRKTRALQRTITRRIANRTASVNSARSGSLPCSASFCIRANMDAPMRKAIA